MRRIAFILAFAWVSIAKADNVWVPPKGTFHLATSITVAQWDQFLQTGSQPVELPGDITQFEFSMFGEYTPIEDLSIDLQIPITATQKKFVYLKTDPVTGEIIGVQLGDNGEIRDVSTNYGLGDVVLGTKYIFWEKYVSLGARAHIKIPGTYATGDVPNAPGDGQFDFGLAFLAGANLPQIRSYFRGSLGYVFRAGAPANQIELMLEPGFNITQRLSARLIYQLTYQFGGTDINYYGFSNDYPTNKEDSHRISAGLGYNISDTVGIFSLYSQTVAGRNTANTKAVTLGMDFSF